MLLSPLLWCYPCHSPLHSALLVSSILGSSSAARHGNKHRLVVTHGWSPSRSGWRRPASLWWHGAVLAGRDAKTGPRRPVRAAKQLTVFRALSGGKKKFL